MKPVPIIAVKLESRGVRLLVSVETDRGWIPCILEVEGGPISHFFELPGLRAKYDALPEVPA